VSLPTTTMGTFLSIVDVRIRGRGIPSKEPADIRIAVTRHDWRQQTMPVIGAVNLTPAQHALKTPDSAHGLYTWLVLVDATRY